MSLLRYLEDFFTNPPPEDPIVVRGDFNFFIDPVIQGTIPNHTISVTITCFQNNRKEAPIDFDIKWCKILNEDVYEVKDYKVPYYHANPADIDLKIRAIVTSRDPSYPGTAILTIGPIILDGTLKPELEGLVLNKSSYFSIGVLSINEERIQPNMSVVQINKPFITLNFDSKFVARQKNRELWQPITLDFETDPHVKIKTDINNVNNVLLTCKPDHFEAISVLKLKFDSRMERDIFYIYLKLMRILKSSIIEDSLLEYDRYLEAPWSIMQMNVDKLGLGIVGYEHLNQFDLVREFLKEMVRVNKQLNEENISLLDSADILEQDLHMAVKEYRALLDDAKMSAQTKKKIGRQEMSRYEKSNQSIIQESSMIVDGVKVKDKRKKKEMEIEMIEKRRELEDDIAHEKRIGDALRREIDSIKSPGKSPQNVLGTPAFGVDISAIQVRVDHLTIRK